MALTREHQDWGRGMAEAFSMVKGQAPLVHMIGDYGTASFCAEAMAAMGARPLMAQAPEEMEEITGSADGLAVNLGQPSEEKYLACERALQTAGNLGRPAVLDPVGAGASALRTRTASDLLDKLAVSVVRGNMSEAKALAGGAAATRGVDVCPGDAVTEDNLAAGAAFVRVAKPRETALPRRLLFGRSHGLRLRLRLWSRLLLRLRRGGFFRLRRLNLRGRLGNGRRIDGFGIDGQRSGRRIDARYGLGRLDEVAFVGIVLRHEIALCLHAGRLEIGFAGFFHENLRLDRRSLDDRRTPSPSISPLFDGGLGKPALHHFDTRRHHARGRGFRIEAQARVQRAIRLGDGHELARQRDALGLVDALLELIAYFEHARPRDGVHILFERYDLFRLARHALCR